MENNFDVVDNHLQEALNEDRTNMEDIISFKKSLDKLKEIIDTASIEELEPLIDSILLLLDKKSMYTNEGFVSKLRVSLEVDRYYTVITLCTLSIFFLSQRGKN